MIIWKLGSKHVIKKAAKGGNAAMEIDKEKFKRLILWFLSQCQGLEEELLAYKTLCAALSTAVGDLDESLQAVRRSQRRRRLVPRSLSEPAAISNGSH